MVAKFLNRPISTTGLPRSQAFRVHEALEVVVVCKYKNFILSAF